MKCYLEPFFYVRFNFSETVKIIEGKEILPENWNSETVYELQYVKNGEQHLLKAVVVDGELIFTIVVTIKFVMFYFFINYNCTYVKPLSASQR